MKRSFTAVLVSISISGCIIHGPTVSQETINTRVSDAAAFDFNCPKEDIAISKINDVSYAAIGCNKKARYLLDKCHPMNWASVCTAFINGPIQEI